MGIIMIWTFYGTFSYTKNWHHHFTHINDYFEYFPQDPRYVGEKMFIMHEIGQCKLCPNVDRNAHIQQNAWIF
jgi:hypothetical protein